jgi:predicted Zn finger-like uncharacterized protein
MRLICPNCGAQYEVAEDVIPDAGRDVQCSNCAHTWFETPGASEARERGDDLVDETTDAAAHLSSVDQNDNSSPAQDGEADAATQIDDQGPGDTTEPSEEDAPQEPSDDDEQPEHDQAADDPDPADDEPSSPDATDTTDDTDPPPDEDPQTPDTDAPAERRPLSPSVAEILREEAAREEARRTVDAEPALETQPDLDLDRPMDRDEQLAEEARRRMARLKGEAAPAIGAATAVAAGARGEMLPDIDEINSSLRSETERSEDTETAASTSEKKRKSGFRRGFMTVILLAIIALLIYMFAPQISAAVPALEPALTSYVDTVNQGRLWLDLQLQGLLPSSETAS